MAPTPTECDVLISHVNRRPWPRGAEVAEEESIDGGDGNASATSTGGGVRNRRRRTRRQGTSVSLHEASGTVDVAHPYIVGATWNGDEATLTMRLLPPPAAASPAAHHMPVEVCVLLPPSEDAPPFCYADGTGADGGSRTQTSTGM